jgi:zinc D-Ala-D-Ala carboxypeptidase
MKLSEHLDLSEVTRSDMAKRSGISNEPTAEHLENFKKLAEHIFEPIRKHFAKPIIISSGYRSEALNKAIGGSLTSQHCKGEAIDIDMDGTTGGVTNVMVFNYIKDNLPFDQLIWEFGNASAPDWVHVSYSSKGTQRKQVLRAIRNASGGTEYKPY